MVVLYISKNVLENSMKDTLKKNKNKITVGPSIAGKGSASKWSKVMNWRDSHSSQDKQMSISKWKCRTYTQLNATQS